MISKIITIQKKYYQNHSKHLNRLLSLSDNISKMVPNEVVITTNH